MHRIPEKSRRPLQIGNYWLDLDLRNPHERVYSERLERSVDYVVAAALIREGDRVLDLGANIGVTSLSYVRFGALEVYAFEPIEELASRIESVGCERIKVHREAVSDEEGTGLMRLSDTHNQGHSLNDAWPKLFPAVFRTGSERAVPLSSLDTLFPTTKFDFIKIDVEGEEEKVLSGGQGFFERHKDALVQIEIYDDYFEQTSTALKRNYSRAARLAMGGDGSLLLIEPGRVAAARNRFTDVAWGPPNYLFWSGDHERLGNFEIY